MLMYKNSKSSSFEKIMHRFQMDVLFSLMELLQTKTFFICTTIAAKRSKRSDGSSNILDSISIFDGFPGLRFALLRHNDVRISPCACTSPEIFPNKQFIAT